MIPYGTNTPHRICRAHRALPRDPPLRRRWCTALFLLPKILCTFYTSSGILLTVCILHTERQHGIERRRELPPALLLPPIRAVAQGGTPLSVGWKPEWSVGTPNGAVGPFWLPPGFYFSSDICISPSEMRLRTTVTPSQLPTTAFANRGLARVTAAG